MLDFHKLDTHFPHNYIFSLVLYRAKKQPIPRKLEQTICSLLCGTRQLSVSAYFLLTSQMTSATALPGGTFKFTLKNEESQCDISVTSQVWSLQGHCWESVSFIFYPPTFNIVVYFKLRYG